MKIKSCRTKSIGLVFFVSVIISLNSVAFSYDKLHLEINGNEYTFGIFNNNSHFLNFFGIYKQPLEDTAGTNLYLFPDLKFVYTEWGDVWEEKLIANGSYMYKDGKLFLTYEFKNEKFPKELASNTFNVLHGRIEKEDYTTGSVFILANDEEMNALQKDKFSFNYRRQTTPFYDWKDIYHHFLKTSE